MDLQFSQTRIREVSISWEETVKVFFFFFLFFFFSLRTHIRARKHDAVKREFADERGWEKKRDARPHLFAGTWNISSSRAFHVVGRYNDDSAFSRMRKEEMRKRDESSSRAEIARYFVLRANSLLNCAWNDETYSRKSRNPPSRNGSLSMTKTPIDVAGFCRFPSGNEPFIDLLRIPSHRLWNTSSTLKNEGFRYRIERWICELKKEILHPIPRR